MSGERGRVVTHLVRGRVITHLVVAVLAGALGFAIASSRTGERPTAVGPTAPSCTPAPVVSPPIVSASPASEAPPIVSASPASEQPPATSNGLLDRARLGDLPALKDLESRDAGQRTPAESLALEAGHAALARQEAQRLVDDVAAEPSLLTDPAVAAHLLRLALDPAVAPTILGGLAVIDHPAVPDLLFELAQRGEPGARLALLADDLLLGAARGRASPALAVALDVRAARSCERMSALLARITELADDRTLPLLERVDVRTGCGPKRADDCWGCLRGGEAEQALADARQAARERRFVAPWSAEARRAAARTSAPAGSAPRASTQRGSAQQRKPVE